MRISEKEWENIDFRKKKYRQLKAALRLSQEEIIKYLHLYCAKTEDTARKLSTGW